MGIKKGDVLDYDYTGAVQSVELPKGTYKLECWGAQGGTYSSYYGGYGGYSVGTINLSQKTRVYIYAGGSGSSSSITGGFNGGGNGISSGRGGGGASDVRIGEDSLYARVIVAGGGGGAGITGGQTNPCGCGGGEYGCEGYYGTASSSYTTGQNRSGGGASQTAGGKPWNNTSTTTAIGSFGQGGSATGYSSGGGGGGWYGGGGAYDNDSDSDGRWGGGGSGYIYTSSTASNYPSGCLLDSSMYLTDASMSAGNTSITSPTGSSETGHSGNGYVRITVIDCSSIGVYTKQNGTWKETTSLYKKVSGIWLPTGTISNVIIKENGSWTKITFTIDGVSYVAEKGMTWEEWVNSAYNTDGFYINKGTIHPSYDDSGYCVGTDKGDCWTTDTITKNESYIIVL